MDTKLLILIAITLLAGLIGYFFYSEYQNDNTITYSEQGIATPVAAVKDTLPDGTYEVQKTQEEWREILTDKEYRILRGGGTELPYANEYYDHKEEGIYVCGACGQKLYSSEHKYKSGTGWPSFWKPLADSLVEEKEDNSWLMTRTEIVCSRCGSHLGHVFDDGPEPTGLRYCMNSAALDFVKKEEIPEDN